MDLLDRLRPRWRHPDPEIRAAAVRELEGQVERLAALARSDPDARVRRIAIAKLDDADVLGELAAADLDPALRALATERLSEVLVAVASAAGPAAACDAALERLTDDPGLATVASTAANDHVRRAALARVSSDRTLRDIVRRATDPAIRREALSRIRDAAVLRSIAVGEGSHEIGLLALEQIADGDTLRAIAGNRAAPRHVRQRAQSRLAPLGGTPAIVAVKDARARQLELCTMVHALRAEPDVTRAAARVLDARREWQALVRDVEPREDVARQFAAACDAIEHDATLLARRQSAVETARHVLDERLAARRTLCEQVERLDGSDVPRELGRARDAWNRLPPADEHGDELSQRFAIAVRDCEARHQQWLARAALVALAAEADALADAVEVAAVGDWKALVERWAAREACTVETDEIVEARRRFERAGERLAGRRREAEQHDDEHRRRNRARLETLCGRLDELAQSSSLKPGVARRALEEADTTLIDLGPLPAHERRAAWTERLTEARRLLLLRLGEVEETEQWRRWANTAAQEEIIGRVEALLESNDLREGARQLGRLQEEWEQVATATPDKSRALWERFRAARNQLRKRCDGYLAANLTQKVALCERVAGLGDSTAWAETAEEIKRVQAEWKEIGPVPAPQAAALWRRFREPCERFFSRRKEHFDRVDAERRENASRKKALCEQAEALADTTTWEESAAAIKQLQAEWKKVGPAPRTEADRLWARFRAACDRFFDRHRRRDELAHEAELAKARAICEGLEAVARSLDDEGESLPDVVGRQIDEAWGEWQRLDPTADDESGALDERLRAACEQIASARPECLRGTRLDPEQTHKAREKLCQRLEALAASMAPAPRAMSLQEMALALRERLATNTIAGAGGARTSGQDAAREVERIGATWARLGPPLGETARALAERFASARSRVLDGVAAGEGAARRTRPS